jgi:hypothetical protein
MLFGRSGGGKTVAAIEPPANLRAMAAEALRAEGVRWLLIANDDHGAADLREHTAEWGLEGIPLSPQVVLYRVAPEVQGPATAKR